MASLAWKRLIRFVAADGEICHGEPVDPSVDVGTATIVKTRVLHGSDIWELQTTDRVVDVRAKDILGPLAESDVPIIRCVGLNYMKHIKEAGRTPPPFPFIFFKPNTCVADHNSVVTIPKLAQDDQADYEGELCFVMGKDAKDVSVDDALSYVGAYTAGDDISSRKWQRDPKYAGGVPQWGFSKGFDKFAPLGPVLVAASEIPEPDKLRLQTIVNGEIRQDESTADLLFKTAYLVSFLSQGTTLQKGSVVMTGTPGGVGAGFKPAKWLKPGDQVQVRIEKIGTLTHGISYE